MFKHPTEPIPVIMRYIYIFLSKVQKYMLIYKKLVTVLASK